MSEILLALKSLPLLVESINKLIEEVKQMRKNAIDKAIKEKIDSISNEITKLKQAKNDDEIKIALDSLYDSLYK